LFLVAVQPGAVHALSVEYGAVGIVSLRRIIDVVVRARTNHFAGDLSNIFRERPFAFMVSLKAARKLSGTQCLEKSSLACQGEAGQHPGNYRLVTRDIPGANAKLKEETRGFPATLDHHALWAERQCSGCATILKLRERCKTDQPKKTGSPCAHHSVFISSGNRRARCAAGTLSIRI